MEERLYDKLSNLKGNEFNLDKEIEMIQFNRLRFTNYDLIIHFLLKILAMYGIKLRFPNFDTFLLKQTYAYNLIVWGHLS